MSSRVSSDETLIWFPNQSVEGLEGWWVRVSSDVGLGLGWGSYFHCSCTSSFFWSCLSESASQSEHTEKLSLSLSCSCLSSSFSELSYQSAIMGYSLEYSFPKRVHILQFFGTEWPMLWLAGQVLGPVLEFLLLWLWLWQANFSAWI